MATNVRHRLTQRAAILVAVLTGFAAAVAAAAPLTGQALPTLAQDSEDPPAQVLVLGVFHFHNPNADYAQFEGIDVLAPERQAEIEEVARRLGMFAPTRIAVEQTPAEGDSLNAWLGEYARGERELTANETQQLGFRLAVAAGHEQLYPVDFRQGMAMREFMEYANEHEPDFMPHFDAYIGEIVVLMNRMQAEEDIRTNLLFMNEPENVIRTHEPYAAQATVGAGDGYIGAKAVAGWYERNLAIFANLAQVATRGERVLLIIGAGHGPIIRELVRAHPDMALVEAVNYLR